MFKTYVMHHLPLVERLGHITQQLENQNILNVEFITSEPDGLGSYDDNKNLHKKVCQITMRPGMTYEYKQLGEGDISLCTKHIAAFEKILEQDEDYALILEDDCEINGSIQKVINESPDDWDVIVLGGKFNHQICHYTESYQQKGTLFLKATHPATNTTCSILYKKAAIPKFLPFAKSFCVPIDWQLNHAFLKAKLNVYHVYPYVCSQGNESVLQGKR